MATLKKCLGVDLGSNTVKVVEIGVDRGVAKVLKAASAETGVEPAMPAEERRAAIVKTLRDLQKRHKFTTRNAVFCLPGQKVFIRRFRLPEASDERLERIVNYEARQQIPFPLDKTDLQWQFTHIPEDNEVEVLLVAVRHDEVADFMGMVDKTGLTPIAVAVSTFAVFNGQTFLTRNPEEIAEALGVVKKKPVEKKSKKKKGEPAEPEPEPEPEVNEDVFGIEEVKGYVNIGAAALDLVIAQHGKQAFLKFSRSVPTSGNVVTQAVQEGCRISSFQDAERIKKHQTKLMTFDFDFEDEGSINRDACSAATNAVDRIVAELRRSLDYFISQPDGMAVDALVLSGGQSLLPGMDTYLEEKLTIPVSVSRDTGEKGVLNWPDANEAISPFMPALGLALQGVGAATVSVDFLPRDRKITRDFPYKTVGIMAVMLAGVIGIASQAGKSYTQGYISARDGLQNVLTQRSDQDMASQRVQAEHQRVADLYDTFAKGVIDRDYWLEFLSEITTVKPPDVLIDRISMSKDGIVQILGLAETQRSAADFNGRLGGLVKDPIKAPILEDVAAVRDPRYEQPVFRFRISFQRSGKAIALPSPTPTPGVPSVAGAGPGRR